MTIVLLVLAAVLLWLAKQIFGALIAQQAKASIPEYTAAKARAAARLLPDDLALSYEEDWLAELESLEAKPFSAIKYALQLKKAARSIAEIAGGRESSRQWQPDFARVADLGLALFLLFLLLPVLLACSLSLKIEKGGRIFASRAMLGKGGRRFGLLSFHVEPATSPARVLRQFGLIELPALFNLLRGDLALIGPPAQLPVEDSDRGLVPLEVRPGLASWENLARWGHPGLTVEEARSRDLNRSLKNDMLLLALTPLAFMRGDREP